MAGALQMVITRYQKSILTFNPSLCILEDKTFLLYLRNLYSKTGTPHTLPHYYTGKRLMYYLKMEKTIEKNKLTQFEIIWGEVLEAMST